MNQHDRWGERERTPTAPRRVRASLGAEPSVIFTATYGLIGHNFSTPRYFWGRLSATASYPYNGAASGGSNFGPMNPALLEAVKARIAALQAAGSPSSVPVPVDLVTASGSGLDPHIGPAAAYYQIERVTHARGLPADRIRQ